MKKILLLPITGIGLLLGLSTSAESSTTAEIVTAFGGILDGIVSSLITAITSFLTNNWPIIVVLGTVVGLTFWLVAKARGAIRGR